MIENIEELVEKVERGDLSPYGVLWTIKQIESRLKSLKTRINDIAINDAVKEDKIFYSDGLWIERRNGKRNWDFKHVPEWKETKDHLSDVELKLKSLWDAANSSKGIQMATEDGEEIILPKVTYSADVLILKEPKEPKQ